MRLLRRSRPRPRCFLNVAVSLDGKIASTSREMPAFPSRADRRMMDRIRARADAILIGAGTLRAADFPLRIRSRALCRKRREEGRPEQPLNVLLSSSLRVPLAGRFFSAPDVRRLVVTSRSAPVSRVRAIASRAEVIRLGRARVPLRRLVEELRSRGVRQLLLEGGGETNFGFLREGLLDEIYLTLCPVVIGGRTSPTPVDGAGFPPGHFRRYRLVALTRGREEIFLHYRAGRRKEP